MLSSYNETAYLPTKELVKSYLADEAYITSFKVLDMAYFWALHNEPLQVEEALPEFWFFIWSKKFYDEVYLRVNLKNYLEQNRDKKFTIYAQKNGYSCDTSFFEVKFSNKFYSEVLIVKNNDNYDLLYSVTGGYSDLFAAERQRMSGAHLVGVPVYEELQPMPFFKLQVDRDVPPEGLEKYELS